MRYVYLVKAISEPLGRRTIPDDTFVYVGTAEQIGGLVTDAMRGGGVAKVEVEKLGRPESVIVDLDEHSTG